MRSRWVDPGAGWIRAVPLPAEPEGCRGSFENQRCQYPSSSC
jgi:hypothetical protein